MINQFQALATVVCVALIPQFITQSHTITHSDQGGKKSITYLATSQAWY